MVATLALLSGLLGLGGLEPPTLWILSGRFEARSGTVATSSSTVDANGKTVIQSSTDVASQLQEDPLIGLIHGDSDLRTSVDYSPRILVTTGSKEGTSAVLHRAHLGIDWQPDRDTRLSFEERTTYGLQDFSQQVAQTDTGTGTGTGSGTGSTGGTTKATDPRLASLGTLNYVSSSTVLRFEQTPAHRVRLNGTATFSVSGGADSYARDTAKLPLQWGPQLQGSATFAAGHLDELGLLCTASRTDQSDGPRSVLGTATGVWHSRLDRYTQLDLSAGLGLARSLGYNNRAPGDVLAYPVGGLSFSHAVPLRGSSLSASLRGALSPSVDALSGSIIERAEARGSLDLQPVHEVQLSLIGSATRNLYSNDAASPSGGGVGTAQVEGRASFQVRRDTALVVGVRGSWITGPITDTEPRFQWSAFTAIAAAVQGVL